MIDVSKVDLTRVYDLSKKILAYYRLQLQAMGINASGQLSDTADFDVEFGEYHMAVYFILESYYWYVERGRGPSSGKWGSWATKYSDIENWLRQKIARGSFVPSHGHTIPRTPKEIERLSYVIVRKIGRFGFYGFKHEGKHPLEEAIKQAEADGIIDTMVDIVMKAYDERVALEIEKL